MPRLLSNTPVCATPVASTVSANLNTPTINANHNTPIVNPNHTQTDDLLARELFGESDDDAEMEGERVGRTAGQGDDSGNIISQRDVAAFCSLNNLGSEMVQKVKRFAQLPSAKRELQLFVLLENIHDVVVSEANWSVPPDLQQDLEEFAVGRVLNPKTRSYAFDARDLWKIFEEKVRQLPAIRRRQPSAMAKVEKIIGNAVIQAKANMKKKILDQYGKKKFGNLPLSVFAPHLFGPKQITLTANHEARAALLRGFTVGDKEDFWLCVDQDLEQYYSMPQAEMRNAFRKLVDDDKVKFPNEARSSNRRPSWRVEPDERNHEGDENGEESEGGR